MFSLFLLRFVVTLLLIGDTCDLSWIEKNVERERDDIAETKEAER